MEVSLVRITRWAIVCLARPTAMVSVKLTIRPQPVVVRLVPGGMGQAVSNRKIAARDTIRITLANVVNQATTMFVLSRRGVVALVLGGIIQAVVVARLQRPELPLIPMPRPTLLILRPVPQPIVARVIIGTAVTAPRPVRPQRRPPPQPP